MSDDKELIYAISESKLNMIRAFADIERIPVSVLMLSGTDVDYIQLLKSVITTQRIALASVVNEIDALKAGEYGSS